MPRARTKPEATPDHQGTAVMMQAALAAQGEAGRSVEGFTALAAQLGFDGFSYLRIGYGAGASRLLEHCTTAAANWVAHYAARGYHLVDPRVTRTAGRSVPVTWNDTDTADPHACAFLADARRYAIRGGVAMALHDPRGGRLVVCWDSSASAAGATRAETLRGQLGTIALLALLMHEAVTARRESVAARDAGELTMRERECLTLAARGMTSCDIAHKLGITERTANFHIGNVLVKLGALNRGEAIARAVAQRLVTIAN
jgi:DNA-binding CsgD family transcriptional regulator